MTYTYAAKQFLQPGRPKLGTLVLLPDGSHIWSPRSLPVVDLSLIDDEGKALLDIATTFDQATGRPKPPVGGE